MLLHSWCIRWLLVVLTFLSRSSIDRVSRATNRSPRRANSSMAKIPSRIQCDKFHYSSGENSHGPTDYFACVMMIGMASSHIHSRSRYRSNTMAFDLHLHCCGHLSWLGQHIFRLMKVIYHKSTESAFSLHFAGGFGFASLFRFIFRLMSGA